MTEYVVRVIEFPPDRIQYLISIFTFIVAFVSVVYTHHSFANQKKYNCLSVEPILYIHCENFDNYISLQLLNGGLGPAFIKDFGIFIEDSDIKKKFDRHGSFSELVEKSSLQDIEFQYRAPRNLPKAIFRNENIILFEYNINNQTFLNKEESKKMLDSLKKLLIKTTICISYTNIYDRSFENKIVNRIIKKIFKKSFCNKTMSYKLELSELFQ
jgi:hypothetical protein